MSSHARGTVEVACSVCGRTVRTRRGSDRARTNLCTEHLARREGWLWYHQGGSLHLNTDALSEYEGDIEMDLRSGDGECPLEVEHAEGGIIGFSESEGEEPTSVTVELRHHPLPGENQ